MSIIKLADLLRESNAATAFYTKLAKGEKPITGPVKWTGDKDQWALTSKASYATHANKPTPRSTRASRLKGVLEKNVDATFKQIGVKVTLRKDVDAYAMEYKGKIIPYISKSDKVVVARNIFAFYKKYISDLRVLRKRNLKMASLELLKKTGFSDLTKASDQNRKIAMLQAEKELENDQKKAYEEMERGIEKYFDEYAKRHPVTEEV